ncbi:MAG: ubiquinol-cytochrome c reductase iron-sulfur subunit [Thermoflexales bacterium]|nr:ubiquinol-cytochrome c reductase iron-sulfur subunit [Thermoflexales bacterium]
MAEPAAQQARGISRREFLNYVWGASMALFMAQFGGAIFLFALPRFREGEFGGRKTIGAVAEKLPQPDSPPVAFPDVKVWLANVGPNNAASSGGQQGLVALYRVCVHLGCLYAWVDSTSRFECPCHGSKYELDGTYIEGPAPRDLDRFVVKLLNANGDVVAQTETDKSKPNYGGPVPLPADADSLTIVVETGDKIDLGKRYFYTGGA